MDNELYTKDVLTENGRLLPQKGEKTMTDSLEKEFEWYLENQENLLKDYDGKFLVRTAE